MRISRETIRNLRKQMTNKFVSPWAVVKSLLGSGRLLSVANRPHCHTLNLTYDVHACYVMLARHVRRTYILPGIDVNSGINVPSKERSSSLKLVYASKACFISSLACGLLVS